MPTRASRQAKGIRFKWKEEDMQAAIAAVTNGTMSKNGACKTFGINKATLLRHLRKSNKIGNGGKKQIGRQTDLPEEIEDQLANHIINLESRFYGLTPVNLRKLAFQIADINGLTTRFNSTKKIAGKEWLAGFLKRHPEISLRSPEATSLARASGFNRTQIETFFNLLISLIDDNNITANNIYNVDESGLTVVQKLSKVLAKKGKHQVGSVTSLERGQTATIVCCMNAVGNYVPPGIIFPRCRIKAELQDGAPPGSMFSCQVSKQSCFYFFCFCHNLSI